MTIYDVLDFGAAGNGTTNDVSAIQKTVNTCTASEGGTVLFPAGRTYFSGTFVIKPNVELRVERSATSLLRILVIVIEWQGGTNIHYPA
jgi:polygalacturonase